MGLSASFINIGYLSWYMERVYSMYRLANTEGDLNVGWSWFLGMGKRKWKGLKFLGGWSWKSLDSWVVVFLGSVKDPNSRFPGI